MLKFKKAAQNICEWFIDRVKEKVRIQDVSNWQRRMSLSLHKNWREFQFSFEMFESCFNINTKIGNIYDINSIMTTSKMLIDVALCMETPQKTH